MCLASSRAMQQTQKVSLNWIAAAHALAKISTSTGLASVIISEYFLWTSSSFNSPFISCFSTAGPQLQCGSQLLFVHMCKLIIISDYIISNEMRSNSLSLITFVSFVNNCNQSSLNFGDKCLRKKTSNFGSTQKKIEKHCLNWAILHICVCVGLWENTTHDRNERIFTIIIKYV